MKMKDRHVVVAILFWWKRWSDGVCARVWSDSSRGSLPSRWLHGKMGVLIELLVGPRRMLSGRGEVDVFVGCLTASEEVMS